MKPTKVRTMDKYKQNKILLIKISVAVLAFLTEHEEEAELFL